MSKSKSIIDCHDDFNYFLGVKEKQDFRYLDTQFDCDPVKNYVPDIPEELLKEYENKKEIKVVESHQLDDFGKVNYNKDNLVEEVPVVKKTPPRKPRFPKSSFTISNKDLGCWDDVLNDKKKDQQPQLSALLEEAAKTAAAIAAANKKPKVISPISGKEVVVVKKSRKKPTTK